MSTTIAPPSAPVKTPPTAPPKAPPAASPLSLIIGIVIAAVVAVVVLKIPALGTPWSQAYDPIGHWFLSTLIAALPVVVLLGSLAFGHVKAHYAALLGLGTALLVAIFGFHMPGRLAAATAVYGSGYGLFPIGWIVLNVIFMYQLTVESGRFTVLQRSMTGITQDRRLQLLLIAFCFGAFFEGASGFGTPVAVTAALLIGLGFRPLQASGLSLIANTAPVAFGALGTPIIALAKVTGISEITLGAMAGRILTPFCILVPFWLICAFVGWSAMLEIWPAILVAGVSFAIPQYFMANYHGPWLVNIVASIISMICLVAFLFVWHPKRIWTFEGEEAKSSSHGDHGYSRAEVTRAWVPWVILSLAVFLWGTQTGKNLMNAPEKTFKSMATWQTPPSKITNPQFPVTALNNLVLRVPPVVLKPTKEPAVFGLNWVSATGTAILFAALISGLVMGLSIPKIFAIYGRTLMKVRFSLLTIAAMMAIGIHDSILRTGCDHGPRLRAHRTSVSVLRHAARLAGRGADRIGHLVQRAVRQPAEDHRPAGRSASHADGRRQQHRRRDGQDDRRAEHRRRQHRDAVVRTRRRHPALRLLAQHRAGRAGGHLHLPDGVRGSVHALRGALNESGQVRATI